MFSILVGHPGIGKGTAINPAVGLARRAGTCNMMSDRLTIQYILEKLAKGFTAATATPSGITFGTDASLMISAPELQVFLGSSDALAQLSELWEGKDGPSDYGTRGRGLVSISKPCISLLGGTSPEWLVKSIPRDAIGGGFTRRVNFVYAKERARFIPWPSRNGSGILLEEQLINDLRHISTLRGEFQFSPEARKVFEPYYRSAVVNEFDDEATSSYITTKWVHVAKLAMTMSVARDDKLIIQLSDVNKAIVEVEQCSTDLQRVFRAVGDSDMAASADRVLRFVEMKGYASRQNIMGAMWRHVSSFELDIILSTLESGNVIVSENRGGTTMYRAVPIQTRKASHP